MTATTGAYSPGPNSLRYCALTLFTPCTVPSHESVASRESRCGILISRLVLPGLAEKSPVANRLSAAGPSVSNSASAAATFIGWRVTRSRMSASPKKKAATRPTQSRVSESRRPEPNCAPSPPLRNCQAQTASATSAPVINAAESTCEKAHNVVEENRTAPMSVSSGVLPGL